MTARGRFWDVTLGVLGLLCLPQLCNLHDEDVEREVEARCPGCVLRSWGVGEGDGDNVYVHMKVRCRSEGGFVDRKWVWLFQRHSRNWRPSDITTCGSL